MANPFTTFRAAEHADSMEGFLALVVPEPLEQYFSQYFHDGVLFRRAMFVFGQPGSGKTTLARLFEPVAISTLLRNSSGTAFDAVRAAVGKTGAIKNDVSTIVGARVPLESDFRDLANLPYSADVRRQLLFRLIQSRTVLRWFAQLKIIGLEPADVMIHGPEGYSSNLELLGGPAGRGVLDRAKAVESAIYEILGALVPPSDKQFHVDLAKPYPLFDTLAEFRIKPEVAARHHLESRLRPFVILDDAHALSAEQFQWLRGWVTRREFLLGRWVLSRLDALSPAEIAKEFGTVESDHSAQGLTEQRDFDVVALQGLGGDRAKSRRQFRRVAEAIGRRYLKEIDVFNRRQVPDLASFLDNTVTPVPDEKLKPWLEEMQAEVKARSILLPAQQALEQAVDDALKSRGPATYDLRVALLRILVHRRAPVKQLNLFGSDETEPTSFTFDESLIAGAEIHLARKFDRPYYYGFDQLALASSENPELFVRLAGVLVEGALNRILRQKPPTLSAADQDQLLREKASELVKQWNFPEASNVRRLVAGIAARCERATDAPNAYLTAGANAMGIPMADFEHLRDTQPALAATIKFGVAYSAFSLSLDRTVKNKQWCIITLGGVACLHHRLTFALGGFVEGDAQELANILSLA